MKTIAEQDALIPKCRQCQTCNGSPLNHHWMLEFPEPDTNEGEDFKGSDFAPILICRHCDAKITEFDVEDENCPDN